MSSNNWWANKMGGQPSAPGYPATTPVPPQQPPQPVPYNPVPQQQPPAMEQPRLPQSAMASSRCPSCGSGNYGSTTPESKARCYDCGYPVVQSGSGMGTGIQGGGAAGPAQPARQISTANNFNPQGIIGHI